MIWKKPGIASQSSCSDGSTLIPGAQFPQRNRYVNLGLEVSLEIQFALFTKGSCFVHGYPVSQ